MLAMTMMMQGMRFCGHLIKSPHFPIGNLDRHRAVPYPATHDRPVSQCYRFVYVYKAAFSLSRYHRRFGPISPGHTFSEMQLGNSVAKHRKSSEKTFTFENINTLVRWIRILIFVY
jgi:hypothetical protein